MNITPKSYVYFSILHVVFIIIVIPLLVHYAKYDGAIWFLLLQATYTAIVVITTQMFPSVAVEIHHLAVTKVVVPLLLTLEVIGVFVLGMLWDRNDRRGSSYKVFFPVLLVIKILQAVALSVPPK